MKVSAFETASIGNRKKQKKNSFANEASVQHPNASVDSNPHQVFTKSYCQK